MNNIVVFGAVQSGKSTLMGYLASASLSESAFANAAQQKERIIRNMEVGSIKTDMILPSFVSLDRDELKDFADKNSPGTSKRIHRKKISISVEGVLQTNRYTFIDTPGSRDCESEQYSGMFEGDLGICVLSAVDLGHYFWLDKTENERKYHSDVRRLFLPIQFWGVYKGYSNLTIVLSKADFFSDQPDRLQEIYTKLKEELKKIGADDVLVIPTSIRLFKRGDLYFRKEKNIFYRDNLLSWYCGPILTEALKEKMHIDAHHHVKDFRLAACNKICLIPNTSNYALRVKCILGDLSSNDKLVLGPMQNADREQVYLSGTVKSLKIEDSDLTNLLQEGIIGGIAFSSLHLPNNRSENQLLQRYKLLPTTVLMTGKYVAGNILRIRLKEDEIGQSTIEAMLQTLPKAQLQFYWLGKPVTADLIEHYEDKGYLYFSLANLSDMANGGSKDFALPLLEEKLPYIECPVTMEYNEYRLEKTIEKYRVKTHSLFHVDGISSLERNQKYIVEMSADGCFLDSSRIAKYFNEFDVLHVSVSEGGILSISLGSITCQTAHKCYKKLREISIDQGFSKYQLRIFQQSHR